MTASAPPGPFDEGYRGPQVCKIVGITYRQLDYWARTDLVRPSVSEAHGSGTQRLYSYADLVELRVVKSLLDAGVSLKQARKAIGFLRSELGRDLGTATLLIDRDQVLLAEENQLIDVLRNGQGVLNVLPLGAVVSDLDARIVEHRPAEAAVTDGPTATAKAAAR